MATRNQDGTVVVRTTGKLATTPKVAPGAAVKNSAFFVGMGPNVPGGMTARMISLKQVVVSATSAWRGGSAGGTTV